MFLDCFWRLVEVFNSICALFFNSPKIDEVNTDLVESYHPQKMFYDQTAETNAEYDTDDENCPPTNIIASVSFDCTTAAYVLEPDNLTEVAILFGSHDAETRKNLELAFYEQLLAREGIGLDCMD
jgi:hypothetical protein